MFIKFNKNFVLVITLLLAVWFFPPIFVFAAGSFSGTVSDSADVSVGVTCPGNICAFQGCTDPTANNYNASAGYDDGSCTYDKPPSQNVLGCMDPTAINYNPLATLDDGSCRYNVPNVLNFTATPQTSSIRLSWTLPNFSKLESVIIVRSANSIPRSINDGEIIYTGAGQSFTDNSASVNTQYYYLAVVKSTTGGYSSGALASAKITPSLPPGPNPPPPPGGGGEGGGTKAGPVNPFEQLPIGLISTTTEEFLNTPGLFTLSQPGEKTKPFFDGSYVKIKGNKPFTISVDYYKLPEVLKTIGMTLYDINNPDQSFSFLLRLNDEKTAYEATIGPLPEDGVYGASIYLINYQDQTIKKYTGQIAVVGSLGLLGVATEKFVKQVAGPVVVGGGVAAGAFHLAFASGNIASFSDLYLFLIRQLGVLLGFMGLKKRNKPWGTVYDSITKRPLDPAYVTVFNREKEVATAITDIDGRYGFSLLDDNYRLEAAKTHYTFPSQILAEKAYDEVYDSIYHGEPFHVTAGEVINKNIPLDPVGFDWNEFVKKQGDFFRLNERREILRARITRYLYDAGLTASIFYLVFWPSIFNIIVLALYVVIFVYQRFWKRRHRVVNVKNSLTGEPVSFAIVRIFYAGLDQEVKKVVTDMVGRFYLLVQPGSYYLTVDHKQPDGSYARIYKSPPTELKGGVWTEDLWV